MILFQGHSRVSFGCRSVSTPCLSSLNLKWKCFGIKRRCVIDFKERVDIRDYYKVEDQK